jgi:hypothetical protein
VIAEESDAGVPAEPELVGFEDRLLVIWRRVSHDQRRLRFEATPVPKVGLEPTRPSRGNGF